MYELYYGTCTTDDTYSRSLLWTPSGDDEHLAYNIKYSHTFGEAGTLTFTLPESNVAWNDITIRRTIVELRLDEAVIFDGQVIEVSRDFYNQKVVTVEGALAALSDSVQFFGHFIGNWNSKYVLVWTMLDWHDGDTTSVTEEVLDEEGAVIDTIHYTPGHNNQNYCTGLGSSYPNIKIYVNESDIYHGGNKPIMENYEQYSSCSTLEMLDEVFSDDDVFYYITYSNGKRYLHVYQQKAGRGKGDQSVTFGVNMLDLAEDISGADMITSVWALGGYRVKLDNPNEWARLNLGSCSTEEIDSEGPRDESKDYPYTYHPAGSLQVFYCPSSRLNATPRTVVEVFDDIMYEYADDDTDEQKKEKQREACDELARAARNYLIENAWKDLTITVNAVDLADAGVDVGRLELGYLYTISSTPHGYEKDMILSKVSIDVQNPRNNKYTFGWPEKTMSDDVFRTDRLVKRQKQSVDKVNNRVSAVYNGYVGKAATALYWASQQTTYSDFISKLNEKL